MLSGNVSTVLAAADELCQLFESNKIKESLQRQNVTWEFIPKRAPWYGGFWERLIGLTKNAIKKTLEKSFISLAKLETIATEIEALLNDRPLTYVSSDHSDPEPLTPAHLLCGRLLKSVPFPIEDPTPEDPDYTDRDAMREQVTHHNHLLQSFWIGGKEITSHHFASSIALPVAIHRSSRQVEKRLPYITSRVPSHFQLQFTDHQDR